MSRARHARRILEPIAAAAKRGGGGAFAAPRVAGFVAGLRSAAGSSSSSPSRIGGFFRCDLVPSSARFRTDHRAPHLARGIAASPHLAADNAADAKKKADDEDAKTPAADPTDPTDPDPDAAAGETAANARAAAAEAALDARTAAWEEATAAATAAEERLARRDHVVTHCVDERLRLSRRRAAQLSGAFYTKVFHPSSGFNT